MAKGLKTSHGDLVDLRVKYKKFDK